MIRKSDLSTSTQSSDSTVSRGPRREPRQFFVYRLWRPELVMEISVALGRIEISADAEFGESYLFQILLLEIADGSCQVDPLMGWY